MSNVIDFHAARLAVVYKVLRQRHPEWDWLTRFARLAQARAKLEAGQSAASVLREVR